MFCHGPCGHGVEMMLLCWLLQVCVLAVPSGGWDLKPEDWPSLRRLWYEALTQKFAYGGIPHYHVMNCKENSHIPPIQRVLRPFTLCIPKKIAYHFMKLISIENAVLNPLIFDTSDELLKLEEVYTLVWAHKRWEKMLPERKYMRLTPVWLLSCH